MQVEHDKCVPWGKDMNWNYDSLPGCDQYEKENQVPFPYCGANCNPKNNKENKEAGGSANLVEMQAPVNSFADKCVPWGEHMNWNYDTLPGCDTLEKNNQVAFPNCGANCNHANDGKAAAAAAPAPAAAAPADAAAGAAPALGQKNRDCLSAKIEEDKFLTPSQKEKYLTYFAVPAGTLA